MLSRSGLSDKGLKRNVIVLPKVRKFFLSRTSLLFADSYTGKVFLKINTRIHLQ